MAFNAGVDGTVRVSDDGSAWESLANCNAASFDKERAALETTALGDTAKNYILGLLSVGSSLSGHFDYGAGITLVRAAVTGGSRLDVELKPDGAAGFKCQGLIENLSITFESNALIGYSVKWQSDGLPAAV